MKGFIKEYALLILFVFLCIGYLSILLRDSNPDISQYEERNVPHTRESRFLELPLPYDKEDSEFRMLVDKQTRVVYLYYHDHVNPKLALTPLLDQNGNISFYEGEIEIY